MPLLSMSTVIDRGTPSIQSMQSITTLLLLLWLLGKKISRAIMLIIIIIFFSKAPFQHRDVGHGAVKVKMEVLQSGI